MKVPMALIHFNITLTRMMSWTATGVLIPTLLKHRPRVLIIETFIKNLINRCYAMESTLTKDTISSKRILISAISLIRSQNLKLSNSLNQSLHQSSNKRSPTLPQTLPLATGTTKRHLLSSLPGTINLL